MIYTTPPAKHRKFGTPTSGKRFHLQQIATPSKTVIIPAAYYKDGRLLRPAMAWSKPQKPNVVIHEKAAK